MAYDGGNRRHIKIHTWFVFSGLGVSRLCFFLPVTVPVFSAQKPAVPVPVPVFLQPPKTTFFFFFFFLVLLYQMLACCVSVCFR